MWCNFFLNMWKTFSIGLRFIRYMQTIYAYWELKTGLTCLSREQLITSYIIGIPYLQHASFCSMVWKFLESDNYYVMLCAICYHLYNLKNSKSLHGVVLLSVKLQTSACEFAKSNTHSWVFFTFLKLCKRHQIM